MTSASPALGSGRPTGWIDPRKPAEYPIVLGDTLQGSDAHQLLNLRYNWQPKSGFGVGQSHLKPTKDGFRLTVGESERDPSFVYSGHTRPSGSEDSTSLALVFDKKDSVFRLEVIGKLIDLNLDSTSSKTGESSRYPKLPRSLAKSSDKLSNGTGNETLDDAPDPTNPFDFRHFLSEAKENAEKASQHPEARTPLPGGRTPMGGFASPIPGATRFKPTTPQFKPATASPAPKKRKTDDAPKQKRATSPLPKKATPKKKAIAETSKEPLSKARISDSDDELSDTIVVEPRSVPKQLQPKGHSRNISGNIGRSPRIVVNDGDLEIDLGSPPHEARGRPRGRIDPGAFRSHTGTPVMGMSSSSRRPPTEDIVMREPDEPDSEDGDVEELELGSPRATRVSAHGSRSVSTVEQQQPQQRSSLFPSSRNDAQEHAPTPPPSNQAPDDDDDLLAAELEAALEEEDTTHEPSASANRGSAGYGLGISGAGQRVDDDDESEVSEEE